jgi:hypothetical protein
MSAVNKHVDTFTDNLGKAFDKYDKNGTPESKQQHFDNLSEKLNKFNSEIDRVSKSQPKHGDAIREKGLDAVNKYLEKTFEVLNGDPSTAGKVNAVSKLDINDRVSEAFLTNKNLQKSDLKNYSSAQLSLMLTASAPSKVLRKGLDDANVVDLQGTPIDGALNNLKKLKNHSQNPDSFNKAVNHVLDKATLKGTKLDLLEKLQYGKDIKQMNTVFDYHVSNGHTKGLMGKMFKGERFENVGSQYWNSPVNTVANSQNPKAMQQFIEDNGRQTLNLRGEYNVNSLIGD